MDEKIEIISNDIPYQIFIPKGCNLDIVNKVVVRGKTFLPVVHGKWIHFEGDDYWEWTCSACMKNSEIHGEQPNFCPNCGARMDEKGKEE